MNFFSALFSGGENPDGKTPANVDASQAIQMVKDGAQLVDVREKSEWQSGHARRAIHIPLGQIAEQGPRKLSKNRPVVAVCASGMRSRSAAATLREQGFNVANLKGGMGAWARAGGDIV